MLVYLFQYPPTAKPKGDGSASLLIASSLKQNKNALNYIQQHNRRLYKWTSPDCQHGNQIDYILCRQRWRSSIQSAKTRLGAGCGSYQKLLIAKSRLKLKKLGTTTRPFTSLSPHKVLGPGIDGRGIPRGPGETRMGTGLS